MSEYFPHALSHDLIQKGLFVLCALALVLVLLSRVIVPTTSFVSLAAAFLIVAVYVLVITCGPFRLSLMNSLSMKWAVLVGLFCGAILGGEILIEYLLVPQDNTAFGLVEFGSVFVIWFLFGLAIGYRTLRARQAVFASATAAIISSLIWLVILLSTYYLFKDTALQQQLFRAEGTYDDFARSGMSDFAAFAMEDLLGAGFFHLLLAPIIASILGILGGMIGKGYTRKGSKDLC